MNLDKYLTTYNITSQKFADMIGSSKSAIDKWRQRRRKIPRPKWIKKISMATNGKVKFKDWE